MVKTKSILLKIKTSLISAIYKELKDTGVKYRNRIRSRISNLKDAKNPNLRINVLLGIITPERLAVLTAEVCF
jgi:transcription elongation factor S-II